MAGPAPIDWDQPFIAHIIKKQTKNAIDDSPANPLVIPNNPTIRLATDETISPVAINRLILEWSAIKLLTNFPIAYAKRRAEPTIPKDVYKRQRCSFRWIYITFPRSTQKMGFQIKMGSINQYIRAQIRIGIPRAGLGRLERQKIPPRRNVIQCKLFRSEYHTSRAQFLTPGS